MQLGRGSQSDLPTADVKEMVDCLPAMRGAPPSPDLVEL